MITWLNQEVTRLQLNDGGVGGWTGGDLGGEPYAGYGYGVSAGSGMKDAEGRGHRQERPGSYEPRDLVSAPTVRKTSDVEVDWEGRGRSNGGGGGGGSRWSPANVADLESPDQRWLTSLMTEDSVGDEFRSSKSRSGSKLKSAYYGTNVVSGRSTLGGGESRAFYDWQRPDFGLETAASTTPLTSHR